MKNIKYPKLLFDSSSPEERRKFIKRIAAFVASVTALGGFANLRAKNTFSGKEVSTFISTDPYLGSIGLFAGNYAMRGFAFCAGQILSISSYSALFSILGATYGGDGRINFALPDLKGRIPVGEGTGPGLSIRSLGQKLGLEKVNLVVSQLPTHTHEIKYDQPAYNIEASNNLAEDSDPTSNEVPGKTSSVEIYSKNDANIPMSASAIRLLKHGSLSLGEAGNSSGHNNIQPSLVLNYVIALVGKFPPKSS